MADGGDTRGFADGGDDGLYEAGQRGGKTRDATPVIPVSNYKNYPKNSPEYLKILLGAPQPPDSFDYQHKKIIIAKKMDRLEYSNRCRMQFIKVLSQNNREKEKAITCYPNKIEETCNKGLQDANEVFNKLSVDHEQRLKSVPRRLHVIHDFCVKTEIQAANGSIGLADLEPKPTEKLMGGKADLRPINPSYLEFLESNELRVKDYSELPVVPDETRDPVMSSTLLQPYMAPESVKMDRREDKERARQRMKEKKQKEKEEKEAKAAENDANLENLRQQMDEKDAMKRQARADKAGK